MNLNNIHEWPLLTRMLLLGVVFFIVLYLGYRFDLSKKKQDLSRAEQQEVDLKQQIELVIRKGKNMQAEVSRLPERQAELVKWKKQLISYDNLPELLNEILKLGGENGLIFSLFTPAESVKVMLPSASSKSADASNSDAPINLGAIAPQDNATVISYAKVPIKVVVVGNYHQIASFISQVANMQWIVAIGNFTLSNENQAALLGEKLATQAGARNLLSAELMLDVYYLP